MRNKIICHVGPIPLPGRRRFKNVNLYSSIGSVRNAKMDDCSNCGRAVRATLDGGRCGRCAVLLEYARRAEAGTLTPWDRAEKASAVTPRL